MNRPPVFAAQRYHDALAAAKAADKLLVLDATARWCEPCEAMDRLTWSDATVVAWLAEHAIAVHIDVAREKDLVASLQIRATPTVIAFRSGLEFERLVGLKAPRELIAWLEAVRRGETAVDRLRRAVATDSDDMGARLSLARALAEARRWPEATEEYVWLWQHPLEHDPLMAPLRGSTLISEIARLLREYPPARARFGELRDAIRAHGAPPLASPADVYDWIALNHVLGDAERIVQWFDQNGAWLDNHPNLDGVVRARLVRLLVERGRWADVSRLFQDPVAAVREVSERVEQMKGRDLPAEKQRGRPQMAESLNGVMRREGAVIVAALLAAGRSVEARAALDEVRRLCPGEKTEAMLMETARNADVPLP
jgi:thiol-disulfide isomerase/thioredoxin